MKNAKGEIEKAGDMVVYVAGFPAIYGRQPLYFQDPVFQKRAEVSPPTGTDRLTKLADKKVQGQDSEQDTAEEAIDVEAIGAAAGIRLNPLASQVEKARRAAGR